MIRWILASLWLAFVGGIIWMADTHRGRTFMDWVERTPGGDKLGHFFLIGMMAFFLNVALRGRRLGKVQVGSLIVAIVFVAEEFTQLRFPWRHFDVGDLAADFIGIAVADWLSRVFQARREQV